MQSFLKEAPLCLILGCVSKTNLKTRSSPALPLPPVSGLRRCWDTFYFGLGIHGAAWGFDRVNES